MNRRSAVATILGAAGLWVGGLRETFAKKEQKQKAPKLLWCDAWGCAPSKGQLLMWDGKTWIPVEVEDCGPHGRDLLFKRRGEEPSLDLVANRERYD